MKEKIVEKVIEQYIFVADDGTEFDDRMECKKYETKQMAEARFGFNEKELECEDSIYVLVRSADDFILLKDYISNVCEHSIYSDFGVSELDYPAVLEYSSDCDLSVVFNDDYMEAKEVCEKYEEMLELRGMSDGKAHEEKQYAVVRWSPEDIMDDDEDSLTYADKLQKALDGDSKLIKIK